MRDSFCRAASVFIFAKRALCKNESFFHGERERTCASTAAFIKPPALDAYEALSLLSDSNSFRIALSENFGCFKADAKRAKTFAKLCTGTVKP